MPNSSFTVNSKELNENSEKLLIDNGDGTFSEQVYIAPTPQSAAAPGSSTPITEAGDGLAVTAGQELFIQNCGTSVIAVKFGAGASATDRHLLLAPGEAVDDGKGDSISRIMPRAVTVTLFFFATGDDKANFWAW